MIKILAKKSCGYVELQPSENNTHTGFIFRFVTLHLLSEAIKF